MPLTCCGDVGLWEMLGVLPSSSSTADSLLASTAFVDVGHDQTTSFAGDIPGGSVGYNAADAAPGDISGMLNGLVAMRAAEKAGLYFNWNSQQVLNDPASTADKLDHVISGGVGNPTHFTEVLSTVGNHGTADQHPTAFADASDAPNVPEIVREPGHHYGYSMGVKHIPIPKSIAPQPAVSIHDEAATADVNSGTSSHLPPVDWGHAGKEWTMATDHARMVANQMQGPEGVKARALQERLETIQDNQMRDAMDLIRNMDSWMKAKNPYIEKVQQLNNLNWQKEQS